MHSTELHKPKELPLKNNPSGKKEEEKNHLQANERKYQSLQTPQSMEPLESKSLFMTHVPKSPLRLSSVIALVERITE